jgi:hypothetical protein
MTTSSEPRRYEFDATQNATFGRLAGAMTVSAVAMMLVSVVVVVAAVLVARSALGVGAILAPLAVAVAAMAVQLYAAARRLRRIVATRGSDIDNLMVALAEMANAYGVQRWLWLTALLVVLLALATTVVGY